MRKKDELNETLADIGDPFGLRGDFDMHNVRRIEPKATRGPSKWLEIHDDANAYGRDFDYRILDSDVFMPLCRAASEWCHHVLPEGLDRYSDLDGNHGYRIPNGLDVLLDAARTDHPIKIALQESHCTTPRLLNALLKKPTKTVN